ncbi:hypothetical protein J437_LFUL003633 [Ladona fulva]|uniref:MGA conserved domain-containing protein n=1 Tax=Ladona fulva TaxID=123851 RepID=A0A8K0JW37_LADFU|nr:hypothetical protein J437_LFUL003633 [Ladona fulva]
MEKEDHSVICSTDARRPKDGSVNLVISPHRSRRLEEKAKALNKCRLSLEDLLCNVDKRNEKFGYVVTNIGTLKSDYSPSKTFSDRCPKTCKKGCMTTAGSSDLLYDHCKSVCKDQEVFAQGENSSYPGDLHGRRCTNYSEKTLCSRVARQTNLKTQSSAVGEISKSQKNTEPVLRRLRRTRSCANLSELQCLDANNSCNKLFTSVIFEDGSNKIDLSDKAHPVEIETAINTSGVSCDSQVKEHSSKGLSDQGLVTSSIFNPEAITVHEITDCQSGVSKVINDGNSFLSQHHEEQSKNPTPTSVLESESANESIVESNVKSESPQEPLLLAEKNQSDGEESSSDDIIMIEERYTLSSQGTALINPTKITLRNSKNCSTVMGDEESSAGLLTEKSLAKMKTHAKCSEENKTDHSEYATNASEGRTKYIIVSSSSKSSVKPSLYAGSIARHVKLNKSGVAVINVLNSNFPSQGSVLIQPKQKSVNSSLEAALLNEVGSVSVISGNGSTCNQFSKEVLPTGAEKHERGEVGRSSAGQIRVTEEGKETRISTPKSVKEGDPSSESPEVLCLGIVQRSKGDSATYSINTLKRSLVKNIKTYSRNSVAKAVVRNLFKEEQRSNDVNLFTNECKLAQKVDQKNKSICDLENLSNEALEVVDKSEVELELKAISHSFPKELKLSKSPETDENLTSDSKFNRIEIPSMSPGQGNEENFVFDLDEDLEKCEDDVLSRHQKGDYSCGFTGFKDTSQITHSRVQPIVVLERLPSWIVKDRTIKLSHRASPLKETAQQLIDSRISEEEILNRKEELQLRRKYKSMSDLSTLIHYDLQKEKELVVDRRRITRSFGEEIKIDYMAKLPDERDVKFKKPENDEQLPFFGFNIPFGFLGLPDHYLVYRSIINKSKQLGFLIDPNLGTGNLVEKSESLYFMGDCNPFRSRPVISQVERDKISPTKILEIASVNRNIHSQYSKSQQRSESHDTFFSASPEKTQEVENLTLEFEPNPSVDYASNLSKKQIPRHSPSNLSYSAVDSSSVYSECDANVIDVAENDINIKQTESEGSACGKDFCRLGCICESLEVRKRVKEHCGHEGCMFSSSCCKNSLRSSTDRTKMSILEYIDISSSEEELVRSKRKRKLPARLLQEEIICNPLSLGGKKQCYDSNISLLPEEKSRKITECRVVLNRFHLSGANVRCLYHFKQNCPCLRDKLLEKPRNVALKSTSGRLQLNSQIIVGHSQIHQHGCYFRTLGSGPVLKTPKTPALKSSVYMPGMNQYRSTIIYPQAPSKVNKSNSFSNGIIDAADSLVMREDLNRGGTLRYFFNSMADFQCTLSQGKMKCSDLEKICSESLTYLPKGAVQIMKLSLLKEMLRKELAYLWMMHLPRGRAHVFLSKENKAPGVACQRVRDLDELSKLPSHIMTLFASTEKDNDHLMSCIQISQSYFWQITGTISFVKNNSNTSKTGTVVTKITDSRPLWSAGTQKKMPKGPNPVNFIPLGSGNYRAINTSSNLKKLKVMSPTTSNLFNHSQPSNVAAKSQPPVSSNSSTSQRPIANYRVWYNLDLNKPFDELRVKANNFRITRLRLQQLFSLARSRKSFVRVSFSSSKCQPRKPLPGILVYPTERNYSVKLGPFPLNKQNGVKTFKYVNGDLIETNSYLTISRVIARDKFQHEYKTEGKISKTVEKVKWENSKDEEITQNVNKAGEVTKMINPKVSEIVSTKDADPGLTIVIQDVQGHYDTFNDIPSPTKSAVPFEGASDAPETWASGNAVSYIGEYNVNESAISHEIVSDASEPLLTSSHYSVSESNTFSGSVNTVTKDSNYSLHDFNTMHHATDSEVIATKINPASNYIKIPSETILNHEELILKEEPNSDPLSEPDCDPLAFSSGEMLPVPVENSGQYDWSGAKGLREIVGNSNVTNSSPRSVPKATTVKKRSSILSELKRKSSSLSRRSILKKNMLSPKAKKLPQTPGEPINAHGNIETGYLIPDVPGIQPIPVARGGMTLSESKVITMKNPLSKDGKLLHILNLGLANLFLNEAILQRVSFFPSNMKINWAFVKVDGIASKESFDGLMSLGDLTTNMFITQKGVFLYDEAVKSKSVLQRCGIGADSLHRFMETRRRRQIINIQKHLASLIGRKENTLISTIRFAHQEIKKLNAECGELENQIYHERCLRTTLLSRLRQVASGKERQAIMESLQSLKRETDAIPTQPIGEDSKDNWTLGGTLVDSSEDSAPGQVKGRSSWTRKRISTGNKDGDWAPQGSKKNTRARKTKGNGSDSKKKLSSGKDKSQRKPQAKTPFSLKFQKQLNILKKYIISSNNYRSKGLGSTSEASKYSILENATSVLAAADAETNSSPIENEESILSSGSDDVDIETLEDDFKIRENLPKSQSERVFSLLKSSEKKDQI